METLQPLPVRSDRLPRKPTRALGHLPGPKGHWLSGNLPQLLPNPGPFLRDCRERYGDCFTVGLLRNQRVLMLLGPQANERVLLDREQLFSSHLGWEVVLNFFGKNLLVRDFEDHRLHRQMMTGLFKPPALRGYVDAMHPIISAALRDLGGDRDLYRFNKQLTLDLAMTVFAGWPTGAQTEVLNRDLSTILDVVMAQRIPLPWTQYGRGLRARDRLRALLHRQVRERRGSDQPDMFTRLANFSDPQGLSLSDQDVVDHMFGILFAAHDTTASTLTMVLQMLVIHPEWQQRLTDEALALQQHHGQNTLCYDMADALPLLECVVKETLRLYAPIQLVPRRTVAATAFNNWDIPANTQVLLAPQATHFDQRHFSDPHAFLPERFLGSEGRASFAYIPFGKGAHMCLGMHFAMLEIKAVLYQLLLQYEVRASIDAPVPLAYLPMVRPQQPLLVRFVPRANPGHRPSDSQ